MNKKECIGIDIGLNTSSALHLRRKLIVRKGDQFNYNRSESRIPFFKIVQWRLFKPDIRWKKQFTRISYRAREILEVVRFMSTDAIIALEQPLLPYGKINPRATADLHGLFYLTWYLLVQNGYTVVIIHPKTVKKEADIIKEKDKTTKQLMLEAFERDFNRTIGNFNARGPNLVGKANKETLVDSFYIARAGLRHIKYAKGGQDSWPKSPIHRIPIRARTGGPPKNFDPEKHIVIPGTARLPYGTKFRWVQGKFIPKKEGENVN